MSKNEIVGKNIVYLINNTAGMNKSKFARELGVDIRTVRRWTNNGFFPTEYITDIASYFGVSLDVLLNVDMANNTDSEGDDYWNSLRESVSKVNQIQGQRDSFNDYLRSLGVEISFERSPIKGTELHNLRPDRVRLLLDGKKYVMSYSQYEDLRNKTGASLLKKLHLD